MPACATPDSSDGSVAWPNKSRKVVKVGRGKTMESFSAASIAASGLSHLKSRISSLSTFTSTASCRGQRKNQVQKRRGNFGGVVQCAV